MTTTPPLVSSQNRSVMRAIQLLRCFVDSPQGATLTELARRSDLNVSTTHRILATLVDGGLLARTDRDVYVPGTVLLALAGSAAAAAGLQGLQQWLDGLRADFGETASMAVKDEDCAVVLLESESDHGLRFAYRPGARLDLHTSAHGRLLLAHGQDPRAELSALGPLADASGAFIDRRDLLVELDRIRDQGYAIVRDAEIAGMTAVAVPLPNPSGEGVRHTVGFAGPTTRMDTARAQLAVARLSENLPDAAVLAPLAQVTRGVRQIAAAPAG